MARGGWAERTMHQGSHKPIAMLLREGLGYRVEAWGNAAEGWRPYLVDSKGVGLEIGPWFHKQFGDTLGDLREAAWRAYQTEVKKGRNWL